jgi:hypothetical protein
MSEVIKVTFVRYMYIIILYYMPYIFPFWNLQSGTVILNQVRPIILGIVSAFAHTSVTLFSLQDPKPSPPSKHCKPW